MILVSLINSKKRFNSGKSIFASHQLLGGNCWEPFLTRNSGEQFLFRGCAEGKPFIVSMDYVEGGGTNDATLNLKAF
jgi:hypothetical protein